MDGVGRLSVCVDGCMGGWMDGLKEVIGKS